MHAIHIAGLTSKPRDVACAARPLGDPKLFDPAASMSAPRFARLCAVSPNGQWMALKREGCFERQDVLTIAQAEEGAGETVVPLDLEWAYTRIRGIANDGMLLFQVELGGTADYGYSRRPLTFKPGAERPTILPPPYDKEAKWKGRLPDEEDTRPPAHTPDCYAPDGTIFGWTLSRFEECHQRAGYNQRYCTWKAQEDAWTIAYLPDSLDGKWVWPAHGGAFTWCDRPEEDDTIHFGLFDGTSSTTFAVTLNGHDPRTIAVARDGTLLGHVGVRDGRAGKNEKGEPKSSYYAYLIRPQADAVRLFNDAAEGEKNPRLEKMSTSGVYIVGFHPGVGYFILRAEGDRYRYAVLQTPGWRIENLCHVTDDGAVYATATCIEKKHGCFRLKLPVLLSPQW